MSTPSRPRKKKKTKAAIKKAADRAEKRSRGEHVPPAHEDPIIATIPEHKPASTRKRGQTLGRRHTYSAALGKAICTMLAQGMPLTQICRRPNMPSDRTVRTWAQDPEHPFSPQYTRARDVGYHRMADEILDAADDNRNDWVDRELPGGRTIRVIDPEAVGRSRLRVEARKWLLSKALPKLYGDKLDVKHDASDSFVGLWRALTTGQISCKPEE